MSRRGDNIHKRKDGRWEGRYIKSRDEYGKAKYASVYAKTYSGVKEKLKSAIVSKESYSFKSTSFTNVLWLWLNGRKIMIKPSTYCKYKFLIEKHIIPSLGNREINDLTAYEINQFLNRLLVGDMDKKGLSNSYVRTIAIIISGAYEYGVNEGLCEKLKNPVIKPSIKKNDLSILNEKEYKKLVQYICDSEEISGAELGVLISLFTGLRIGEICALRWADIDTENSIINVSSTVTRNENQYFIGTPKTRNSIRSIPINFILLNHLKLCHRKGVYALSQCNDFINIRTFENQFKRILFKAGIRYTNFHTLRHTFATRCIESGMDVKSLSEILGHANSSITLSTYVHPSMEQKIKQINLLLA